MGLPQQALSVGVTGNELEDLWEAAKQDAKVHDRTEFACVQLAGRLQLSIATDTRLQTT